MMSEGSRPASTASWSTRSEASRSELGDAEGVPHVGVPGDEGQRAAGAGATDPDRRARLLHRQRSQLGIAQRHDVPVVGHDLAGEQPGHDLERVLEQREPLGQRRERDAELGVLLVEPGGAERQLEPAVRRVVDRDGLGGQHRRVAVGHTGDEQAEPDARRHAGERGERGHALERLARSLAVHRLEVVEAPHAVEAQLLRELHPADELVPRHALLRHIESESHGQQRNHNPHGTNTRVAL